MNSIVNCLTVVCRTNSKQFVPFVARQLFAKRGICVSSITCSGADSNSESPEKVNKKTKLADNWGSKKAHRKVKLNLFTNMADPKTEVILSPLRFLVKEQVRVALQCIGVLSVERFTVKSVCFWVVGRCCASTETGWSARNRCQAGRQ